MPAAVDVVTVPDFRGKNASLFEARTLFFLASWLKNAGMARDFPLHLACIGAPPDSVRALARTAGARISLHNPIGIRPGHHVGNKLRGLEVIPATKRVLLLDVDTLILSDFSHLLPEEDCIAATPADRARLSDEQWESIYRRFNLDVPRERFHSIEAELDLCHESGAQPATMFPYYNSGVLLAPWDSSLRTEWRQALEGILAHFDERNGAIKSIHESDQAGLAIAVEILKRKGQPFRRLPLRLHVGWRHLYAGLATIESTFIFHAMAFMRALEGGPLSKTGLAHAISSFCSSMMIKTRYRRLFRTDLWRGRFMQGFQRYHQACRQVRRLERELHDLCRQYVLPALPHRRAA